MRLSRGILTVAAASIGVFAGACGDDIPASPTGSSLVRVEITGPATIAPGQSATYSAVEILVDGTRRAVTAPVWSTSDGSVIQITPAGVATATSKTGEAVLSVQATRTASKEVMVLPPGTFRLVGQVMDTQALPMPIPGARVAVSGGPSAISTDTGSYRLYGVPGSADIRVTREGYRPIDLRVELVSHTTRTFQMELDAGARNFAGNYVLTLEAAEVCPFTPPLSDHLKVRTYEAILSQSGAVLDLILTEPRFFFVPTGFRGVITAIGANFTIDAPYYGPRTLVERLSDGSTLMISGFSRTTWSDGTFSGSFTDGFFSHFSEVKFLGDCRGARFTLRQR